METNMEVKDLEVIYDELARQVDRAGDKSELFLAKLSLLLANRIGDKGEVLKLIESSAKDL
jgi:hypothetical protein